MQKYKCIMSYDGTNYSGFQIQPNNHTIQGEIEKALAKMHKGEHIRIYPSGRTDTGVHAKGQTFHFKSPLALPNGNWLRALNSMLPDDMHISHVEEVDASFHARYDALEKEYRYYVRNSPTVDVFKRNYAYHFPHQLNLANMQEACQYLQGEHDFTTFSSARATAKGSRIRHLSQVRCRQLEADMYEFTFKGNGFLYHMVRIMVGALIDIGVGDILPADIPKLLGAKDRRLLGDTVPPEGLYLWEVTY